MSLNKVCRKFVIGCILVVCGAVVAAYGTWQFLGNSQTGIFKWIIGPVCLLMGVIGFITGLFWTILLGRTLLRGDRFIIGKQALQRVSRSGVVLEHIPYGNIEEIRLDIEHHEPQDAESAAIASVIDPKSLEPTEIVVIVVNDPQREDTLLGVKRFVENPKPGFEYSVDDLYTLPQRQFCKKLRMRWKKWQGKEAEESAMGEKGTWFNFTGFRRPSQKADGRTRLTPAFLIGLGIGGALAALALVGLILVVVLSNTGSSPAPQNPPVVAGPPQAEIRPPADPPQNKVDPPKSKAKSPKSKVNPPQQKREPQPLGEPEDEGPVLFLADLQEFDVKSGPWPYTKNGQIGDGKTAIMVTGVVAPRSLGMHPPPRSYSAAKFHLDRQGTLFKATVALNDGARVIAAKAVFEVLGDGRSLWKSALVSRPGQPQECLVDVTGVDVLELRVHSQSTNNGLHAVWLWPRVLPKKDGPG
jgi:hypothetical protein